MTVSGTSRDTVSRLAVLVPAAKRQPPDGSVYSGSSARGLSVVRATFGADFSNLTKTISGRAWARVKAAMVLRKAHNNRDAFAAMNALARLCALDPKNVHSGTFETTFGSAKSTSIFGFGFNPATDFAYDLPTDYGSLYVTDRANSLATAFGSSVAVAFSRAMRSAKVVLWWNLRAERLEPGILCKDLREAAFVTGALDYLMVCPDCDQPFFPDRPDQQYCSIRCRERFRKRRLRAKTKRTKIRKVGTKKAGGR